MVCIICDIPLGIPVDELVTWGLAGDGRLARALETCDKKGWDALPLAAAELARLFPVLGVAAEDVQVRGDPEDARTSRQGQYGPQPPPHQ
jgi:hypothetical protein